MTSNIIKGIDEVIKGLTTIKGAIMTQGTVVPTITEAVKEAVEEVLTDVVTGEVEEDKLPNTPLSEGIKLEPVSETVGVTTVAEIDLEATIEDEPVKFLEDKKVELEGMKYNDLKALASSLELSAKGKKVELVERILEFYADGGVLNEEEEQESGAEEIQDEAQESKDTADEQEDGEADGDNEDEDRAEFVEFLESLETNELREIAEEVGVKVGKRVVKSKLVGELVDDLDKLVNALDALGYYDDEDEEEGEDEPVEAPEEEAEDEEDERVTIVEEYGLEEYTVEELADICAEFELSTKGKKQALIDRIVKGILDGTIELEDDDEEEEEEEAPEKEAPLKKVSDSGNPVVTKKEAEVEADIRGKYEKGKLKDNAIKKFLDKYNEGDPECAGCKGCSKEDMLECYIDIHKGLVDDDGDVNDFEEPYMREEEYFCCGREIKELENGNLYCQVCGQEYVE